MKKLLFQGDSITDCNRERDDYYSLGTGYAHKVSHHVLSKIPTGEISFINRGISGNTTSDLLKRYETDLKQINPDIVSILIGINDTWRRYDRGENTSTEQFYEDYNQLLFKIKSDMPATKIIIIEPFLLNTVTDYLVWREDLDPKIGAVRRLARTYADAYIALDGLIQQYIVGGIKDVDFAEDAVHPTDLGHEIIAKEYYKVLKNFL